MPWDPDLQNYYQTPNNPYSAGGYEKAKLRKLFLIATGAIVAIALLIVIVHLLPESQQDKYIKSATAAAKKQTPHPKVSNLKVAGGFALSTVSDPTDQSQENSGNITVFRVNKDGAMTEIATGSYFGPLYLLGLGIPLATQAKLTGSNLGSVEQNLASQCGYSNGTIGMYGFGGSFSPGQWQIDASTLDILSQKLQDAISTQDAKASSGKSVICVNATQKNSNVTTNKTTYISTYTLQVQFVTSDGTLTMHTITFTNGSPRFRTYTLDGQNI
jgi:hypothetical protein